MSPVYIILLVKSPQAGGWINIGAGVACFSASIYLVWFVLTYGAIQEGMFYVDAFNVYLIALTSLVGMTTSIFSRPYMAHELHIHRVTNARMRLYHASFQGFMWLPWKVPRWRRYCW